MKYDEFRDFKIERTCNKEYKHYKSYKKFLKKDFHYRCAYCNTWDYVIEPLGFAIDHYVPRKTFKNIDKTFSNNYNNLMYVCPKCNREKSDKFKGNIDKLEIKNELFYNPVEKDYNQIFFRNEFGGIDSEDEKAIENVKKQLEGIKIANECGLATRGEFKEDIEGIETVLNLIQKQQAEIEKNNKVIDKRNEENLELVNMCLKKDKIIDLMAEAIFDYEYMTYVDSEQFKNCKKKIIKNFEKKVEGNE